MDLNVLFLTKQLWKTKMEEQVEEKHLGRKTTSISPLFLRTIIKKYWPDLGDILGSDNLSIELDPPELFN